MVCWASRKCRNSQDHPSSGILYFTHGFNKCRCHIEDVLYLSFRCSFVVVLDRPFCNRFFFSEGLERFKHAVLFWGQVCGREVHVEVVDRSQASVDVDEVLGSRDLVAERQ